MKVLAGIAVAITCFVLGSTHAGEKKEFENKIVGLWVVTKSDDTPAGSSVEFTKDGKLILIQKGKEGKPLEAKYKVEGDKLTTTRTENGKMEINIHTIQSLTETTLITLSNKGKRDELKRVTAK